MGIKMAQRARAWAPCMPPHASAPGRRARGAQRAQHATLGQRGPGHAHQPRRGLAQRHGGRAHATVLLLLLLRAEYPVVRRPSGSGAAPQPKGSGLVCSVGHHCCCPLPKLGGVAAGALQYARNVLCNERHGGRPTGRPRGVALVHHTHSHDLAVQSTTNGAMCIWLGAAMLTHLRTAPRSVPRRATVCGILVHANPGWPHAAALERCARGHPLPREVP
jgi:hypothetical protein